MKFSSKVLMGDTSCLKNWNLFKVLIKYWIVTQLRPIPRLVSFSFVIWDQDQYLSWHYIVNETNTKTCLDLTFLLRPRPIPGLEPSSLDFQDQYQESCWTLFHMILIFLFCFYNAKCTSSYIIVEGGCIFPFSIYSKRKVWWKDKKTTNRKTYL